MEPDKQNKKDSSAQGADSDLNEMSSISKIIHDLLAKYNLQENHEELVKKYFGEDGRESNGAILLQMAKNIILKGKTEKESLAFMTEKLGTPQIINEQIFQDIKKNLLPALAEWNRINRTKGDEAPILPPSNRNEISEQKFSTIENTKNETGADAYRESIE